MVLCRNLSSLAEDFEDWRCHANLDINAETSLAGFMPVGLARGFFPTVPLSPGLRPFLLPWKWPEGSNIAWL